MDGFVDTYTLIREYLKKGENEKQTLREVQELYRRYLQKLTWGIQKQDIEYVRDMTDYFEYIRSVFEKHLKQKTIDMDIAYRIGIAIGESQVGEAWVREQQDDNIFTRNMTILLSKAHIKDILMGIYNCPGIQHKNLAILADIKANYLNQLATALEEASCIRRFGNGKCTYYELTLKGRDYVRKHLVAKMESNRRNDYFGELSKFDTVSVECTENLLKRREEKLVNGKMKNSKLDKYSDRSKGNVIYFEEYIKSGEIREN